MMDYPLTLAKILDRAERWFPRVEVVGPERRSDYAEVGARARRLARALVAAGLRPGERVATLLWNDLTHLEAYFGVPLAGGVVHPLNLRQHPRQWLRILRQAGDRVVLVDRRLLPAWREIAAEAAGARVLVCPDDYEAFLAGAPEHAALPEVREDDGATMNYTSGTTAGDGGEPKGVICSHRALCLHALATALPDALDLRQRDVSLTLVPMFHANAWGVPYTATLLGLKQVLVGDRFDAAHALDLLAGEQVTRSAGVPVVWQGILDLLERQPEGDAREPRRWKLSPELRVNLGGAPAAASLFERFDGQGIAVNMGWGMTEMTPVGAMNPLLGAGSPASRRLRQGRLLPFVEGRTAPSGELEVRGPWVADAYHGGAAAAAWTPDGWFQTGDVVEFDDDGLMGIVDRNKDLIRSGGEWISSVALENALACCPGIREAAVVAMPHPKWQERPLALVVLQEGAEADVQAWRRHLARDFPAWQCPDEFRLLAALPRTGTGKIDKVALRRDHAASAGSA